MEERSSIHVRSSPTRCPYCHDDGSSHDENGVCDDCLARHHKGCWAESGQCGSFRGSAFLAAAKVPASEAIEVAPPRPHLDRVELEAKLARLDREWLLTREPLLVPRRRGSSRPPGWGSVVASVVGAVFAVVWTILASSSGAAPAAFGCALFVLAAADAVRGYTRWTAHEEAETVYQARRSRVVARLAGER